MSARPVAAPFLALSLPSAFAPAVSTLGLVESALEGGAHGLFAPPVAPDQLTRTPVLQAVPTEQTVPPTAPALSVPVEQTAAAAQPSSDMYNHVFGGRGAQ